MSTIAFTANGKPATARTGETVAGLLHGLALGIAQVVVEYNGEPLERVRFEQTVLREGDRIEIAQMVGGG